MILKPHPLAVAVYSRAFAEGIDFVDVVERSKVGRATWHRIRRGRAFRTDTMDRLNAALNALIAEAESESPPLSVPQGGPTNGDDTAHG